jgi:hypothetical protein
MCKNVGNAPHGRLLSLCDYSVRVWWMACGSLPATEHRKHDRKRNVIHRIL